MSLASSKPLRPTIHGARRGGSSNVVNDDFDLDIETSLLIAKLALDDLAELHGNRKGKARLGAPLSDVELAYQLQAEQYQELLFIAEDARYAKSVGDALTTDAAYLDAHVTAEEAATEDRRAAEMLSRDENLPPPKACQIRLEHPAFVMHPEPVASEFDQVAQRTAFDKYSLSKSIPKLSVTARSSGDRNKRVACAICHDPLKYTDALHTPCGHDYCRDCIVSLADHFTRDESLYPLRCCQEPIPIESVRPFLSFSVNILFQRKHAEYSVLSKDRIYCVNLTCSAFLGSSEGRLNLEIPGINCPGCQTSTCPRCKQAAHPTEDCTVNAATQALRELARQEGWQTCPGCNTLIELQEGCFHMTCQCRAEFCYLCAAVWKKCTCPHWDEGRLLATARRRVENEVGRAAAQQIAPIIMARRVERRAQELRVNHDCMAHNWRYRHGGGACEECHYDLPNFLLMCRNCSLLACVRCSKNRL
ncbi:hypothetical protein B0H34DRAFT_661873 [Crassisporium funariophilum]|nr:hypothetical protein B0H34DRAFT_661873 [Crassisporium funariophilum]